MASSSNKLDTHTTSKSPELRRAISKNMGTVICCYECYDVTRDWDLFEIAEALLNSSSELRWIPNENILNNLETYECYFKEMQILLDYAEIELPSYRPFIALLKKRLQSAEIELDDSLPIIEILDKNSNLICEYRGSATEATLNLFEITKILILDDSTDIFWHPPLPLTNKNVFANRKAYFKAMYQLLENAKENYVEKHQEIQQLKTQLSLREMGIEKGKFHKKLAEEKPLSFMADKTTRQIIAEQKLIKDKKRALNCDIMKSNFKKDLLKHTKQSFFKKMCNQIGILERKMSDFHNKVDLSEADLSSIEELKAALREARNVQYENSSLSSRYLTRYGCGYNEEVINTLMRKQPPK